MYKCKNCGYEKKEDMWDVTLLILKSLILGSSIGILIVILIVIFKVNAGYSFTILDEYTINNTIIKNYKYTKSSKIDSFYLRSYAINLTRNCGSDEYCYMTNIFYHMGGFDYIYSGNNKLAVYNPKDTIMFKAGDCKNLAVTYCSLLYNIGVDCDIKTGNNHAWNEIKIENKTYSLDLTSGIFYEK